MSPIRNVLKSAPCLREQIADDFSFDVGQPEVATGVAVSEPLVIKAKTMENGRVEVVHRGAVFNRSKTKLIRGAIRGPALDPATGQPNAEAIVIVIAAKLRLAGITQLY